MLFRKTLIAAILIVSLPVGMLPAASRNGEELLEDRGGRTVVPEVRRPTPELISSLKLPEGFKIGIFAEELGAPRMICVGEDGTVYVTRREAGDVIALRDIDGNGRADSRKTVVGNLPGVHGITIHGGRMYLCTARELYVADLKGSDVGPRRKVLGGLPPGGRHPNRTIAFGPDGWLYITVGSTCNCCIEKNPESAAIIRVREDGSGRTIFATGLRNTLGFGWHPLSREMYGMDNGSDGLGDEIPHEELNRLEEGRHYGWPFVYDMGEVIKLKTYPKGFDRKAWLARSTSPVLLYTAHTAPLQMAFYTGSQFPEEYRNDAFVAMHGSWNRKPPAGYEVLRVKFTSDGKPMEFKPFLTGFLVDKDGSPWTFGRPAGIAIGKDGSLLVGCDKTGVIYRIHYEKRPE